jgi:ABC-type dipeptide/oligopeptide/nickel transport system permease component
LWVPWLAVAVVTNVILIERAFNLLGFFRSADIRQFGGYGDKPPPAPSLDDVQALVVEAAFLIAVTMFLADVLRARLDPRIGARS